jgi:hypothetical protein
VARSRGILSRLRNRDENRPPEPADITDETEAEDPLPAPDAERAQPGPTEAANAETGEWVPATDATSGDETGTSADAPGHGDTSERIRIAADRAGRASETRAMGQIMALEQDLEQARSSAADATEELRERLERAETEAEEAAERAERYAQERDEADDRAKRAAAKWLKRRMASLKAEAREQMKVEVERVHRRTGRRRRGGLRRRGACGRAA